MEMADRASVATTNRMKKSSALYNADLFLLMHCIRPMFHQFVMAKIIFGQKNTLCLF